ncbi:MAG: hypothetical protein CL789_01330 [Chloroflexi bacterium]|nr:hypothetical protein [Chloroflexota bacterium]HCU79785.1 hypothetical protein [Chloroflexota bacterium]|tara:strand:+ start:2501 stop:3193 length:693 start_codon:yes stop_codon:yes gene_type:complete
MINLIVPPLIIALTIGPLISKQQVEFPSTKLIVNITNPKQGDRVQDTVQIMGTVGNAEFDHYELHFALYPNPTDTWFPIVLSGTIPIVNGMLGQWETNGISDGIYIVRLKVFDSEGNLLAKSMVNDISINSEEKLITQTAESTIVETKTPNFSPTTTPLPNPIDNSQKSFISKVLYEQQQENDHISTFGKGAAYSIFTFLALGLYLQLRRLLRPHLRRLLRNIRNDLHRS